MNRWHVAKVGGSLFDLHDLANRLRAWSRDVANPILFIPGGGDFADAVRKADAIHQLGDEVCHSLCIEVLGVTARVLAAILPEAELLPCWDNVVGDDREPLHKLAILDVRQFLVTVEPRLEPPHLPHSWDVTSDSIAARVATALKAEALTLLKSASAPTDDFGQLAKVGYVDHFFPQAAQHVPLVSFANLRDYIR